MKYILVLIILLSGFGFLLSQEAILTGKVLDKSNGQALFGVNIFNEDKVGTTTDYDGSFSLNLPAGKHTVFFQYIGFIDNRYECNLESGGRYEITIKMESSPELIDEVVVSAGKFEQKLSDVTVSMEVLKPERIENLNPAQIDQALNYIPGLEIIDDQPSIRSGSGYSFGAGSRVMVLIDELPILSPDAGDTKWNFVPVENISQVEVIKGASSALFGSSALNGVVNIRTAFPGDVPKTKITAFSGMYMNPEREELIWWGNTQPLFSGLNFLHSRKIGNLDLVIGGNGYSDDGYRSAENEERLRVNTNIRYRDKKIQGLSYGVNTNYMVHDKSDFFMWLNDSTGGYLQPEGATLPVIGKRWNIDPYVDFLTKKGNKHSLRTRYYYVENIYKEDSAKNSRGDQYYGEYQYNHKFKNDLRITSGISATYAMVDANLFGDHHSSNFALFAQADKKIDRLSLSAGFRAEYFRIDTSETVSAVDMMISNDTLNLPVIPVFRAGANYRLADYTFLRASFGQGFRFPTIAEKYTATTISSLKIFPNPELELERGWSAEFGVKQGVKISNWKGYLDIAGFWTEYWNMMEFAFGFYDTLTYRPIDISTVGQIDPLTGQMIMITMDNMGFQSQNVGRAQITGVDITLTGKGKILNIPTSILLGYVYTNPVDLTIDANDTTRSTQSNMLKYRYYHSVKGDIQFDIKKLSIGFSFRYYSHMINVDEIFLIPLSGSTYILPGYAEYREKHNKGNVIFDARLAYQVTENSKFSIMLKNLSNVEYMTRPGDLRPPRSMTIQYLVSF